MKTYSKEVYPGMYRVVVRYEVLAEAYVEATSEHDAVEKAYDVELEDMKKPEYVDGSFKIESVEYNNR